MLATGNIDVFISHHTSTCLPVTQAICNALEGSGLRCWYAPRDTQDIYASSIVSAINKCRVFVLVLNRESSLSLDVLNEINLAVERLRRNEPLAILPFQISPDEIGDDAKYYLGRIHWIDAISPPMEDRIRELKLRILTILEKHMPAAPVAPVQTAQGGTLKSTPLLPNVNFLCRSKELACLDSLLQQYHKLFVQGMGGIGKSELTKAYALKNKARYHTVIFATYQTSLQDLLVHDPAFRVGALPRACDDNGRLESDEVYFAKKLDWLQENTDEGTLFIIDNFDTTEDEQLEAFLAGPYTAIFTTRNDFEELGLPVMHLTELDPQEQQLLFSHYYRRTLPPQQRPPLRQLLEQVNGHTLAIEIIAKFMVNRRLTPDQMLAQLKESGIQSMAAGTVAHGFHRGQSGYGNIRQLFHLHNLTEQELYILRNLALVPLTGLDTVVFGELCELEDYYEIDELIRKSWIRHDPVLDTICLHPLIRDVVLAECGVTLDACRIMVRNLTEKILQLWSMPQEEKQRYGNLGKSVYETFPQVDLAFEDSYRAFALGAVLLEQFDLGRTICMKCLDAYETAGGYEKETAECYYRQGANELHRNNPEDAAADTKRAIEILRKVSPDTPRLAYMVKYLAWINIGWFDNYEETEQLLHESNRILLLQNPVNELDMASQNAAYANIYHLMGQQERALEYAEKSYAVYATAHGELHGNTVSPMIIKAKILSKMGQAEEAVALGRRVLDLQIQLDGDDHQLVLNRYEALGMIYTNLGQIQQAKDAYTHILEALERRKDSSSPFFRRIREKLDSLA